MFETSMVQGQAKVRRGRAGLFAISIVAHSAIILGVAAVGVASVDFPTSAPDEVSIPLLTPVIQIPPPLGRPDGGGAPPKPVAEKPKAPLPAPPPNQITAPPAIPDEVPVADATPSTGNVTTADAGDATGPGTASGPRGQEWGVDGGLGDLDAPPVVNATPAVEQKVYVVGGEVKSPVAIYKVQPPYPASMVRTRMRATVAVRCIIDKNGNVRDPQVMTGSLPPFNDAVINAVTKWRFQPGSYRGQAVETYLDLTVSFAVN